MAFPKAKIFGIDLSEPYLRVAKKNLGHYQNLNFLQGDGGLLPFKDDQFDAVYSVFLYHELPLKIRSQVIQESVRVLKSGGAFGYIDSIQKGDCPPFDFFLTEFPKNFHEPFYMNYISNPMNQLLELPSLEITEQGIGLLSKFALARKK